VPAVGLFAAVNTLPLETQIVWFGPATDVGVPFTRMLMVADDAVQGLFEIVHLKTFVPVGNAVTPEVFNVGFVIVPPPETSVQLPVPTAGLLPAKFDVPGVAQTVWLAPALATVGNPLQKIVMLEIEAAQGGLEIVHLKTFVPVGIPVIPVKLDVGVVIIPPPEINVQLPVPTAATFAFIIAKGLEIQTDWFGPAFAIVGIFFTTTVTLETEGRHGGS